MSESAKHNNAKSLFTHSVMQKKSHPNQPMKRFVTIYERFVNEASLIAWNSEFHRILNI